MAEETNIDDKPESLDFIRQIITDDIASNKWGGSVVTRFPPEPNGYLHIGHAKSILLNFGIAEEFGGTCRLRFDDTNPSKEDQEYVDSIIADVAWLTGRDDIEVLFASDYFEQMYTWAVDLIKAGKAYVDDQNAEQIRENRGTVKSPGVNSPYRDRGVDENLDLFARMRAGEFQEGERVLRAKIDMASPNMLMRDPLMYRIVHADHHRTGNTWRIYPLYDWAHGLEDSLEGVTHSICTLEFQTHRPLYDWFLDQLGIHHSQQIEFNRLNLTHTVMSKRKFSQLVDDKIVNGWDDPRMPTISGLRRRGVSPAAIKSFIKEVGVTRVDSINEWALFEHHIRQVLNVECDRAMAVLDPILLEIENWEEGRVETFQVARNPENPEAGKTDIHLTKNLFIESADFMEEAPKKFFRMSPGREVRLRGVGLVTCTGFDKDDAGNISKIRCTMDMETLGGKNPADGRKVKGTLHWISVDHARDAEVRIYDHLFQDEDPSAAGDDWIKGLNQNSLNVITAKVPAWACDLPAGSRLQFERTGYFSVDPDTAPGKPVFNRTATLRDGFKKKK